MAIEAIEYVTTTGKLAEIVGGKQRVEIRLIPAHVRPAYRTNPSVNCTRPGWDVPAKHFAARYLVEREDGVRSGHDTYERALEVALRVAARRPKVEG